jgi:hypothetical protein
MLWLKSRAAAPSPVPTEVQAVTTPVAAPAPVAPKPAADTAALQEQLASKERIIERLQQELQQAQRPAPVTTERTEQRALRTDGQPGRGGFDMERLRTEDPERYAEIRERMKTFTEQMNSATNKRNEFIAGLDPKLVKQEDQENLAKLQDGMKKMAELTAQMQQAQANGTELAPETRREMWELTRELQPLMGVARTAALTDLALQLGYKREATGEFVEYVNELIEQTSLYGGMMGRGMGGGPGGNTGRDGGGNRGNR